MGQSIDIDERLSRPSRTAIRSLSTLMGLVLGCSVCFGLAGFIRRDDDHLPRCKFGSRHDPNLRQMLTAVWNYHFSS
jgi:hypothetical protein